MATDSQKRRGAFYTPKAIASFLVNWSIRSPHDAVFDPGYGEAIFLLEAYRRLVELGARREEALNQLYGIELHPEAYRRGLELLEKSIGVRPSQMFNLNFFTAGDLLSPHIPFVDAIVGNPPYVRYHHFSGADRTLALNAARRANVHLPQLASSWAPYLVHAVTFLKERGRLAMVLPGELLDVNYADAVREFLLKTFGEVTIITFEKRIFPEVLEETIFILADRKGDRDGLRVIRLNDLGDLQRFEEIASRAPPVRIPEPQAKWLKYLLSDEEHRLYEELIKREEVIDLGEVAKIDIGVVTGNNRFFLLTSDEITQWGIEPEFYHRAIRKAADIPGLLFTEAHWEGLRARGEKCFILKVDLSPERLKHYHVWNYIAHGEELGVPKAYKCRTRKPWYAVPYIRVPYAFLTYMAHDVPRLVLNEARAVNPNTIHGVYFKSVDQARILALVVAFYNTLSLLSAELVGRSYGGGVLKLETKEAEAMKIVDLDDEAMIRRLNTIARQVDQLLRERRADEAIKMVDQIILKDYLKLDDRAMELLQRAYRSMRAKRLARSSS